MYGYQGNNSQPYSYQNPNGSSYGNIGQYTGPYHPYYSNASTAYNAYPSNDQPRSSLGALPQEYSQVGNGIPRPYFFDSNSSYPRPYQGLPFSQSMEISIPNSYDSCPRNCHCCESMKPKYFPPNNSIQPLANTQSSCDSSINATYNGLRKGLNSGVWKDQLPAFQESNNSSPSWSLPKCGNGFKTEPCSWQLTPRQTGKFEGIEHLSPKVSNTYILPQQHQRKVLPNNQTYSVLNSNSLLPTPSTRPTQGRGDEHMGNCFSGYQYSSSDFQKNIPELDVHSKPYLNKIPTTSRPPYNLSNNCGGGFPYKFSTPNSKGFRESQKCTVDSPKLVTPLSSAIVGSIQRRLPTNNVLDGTNEMPYCQPGMIPSVHSIDASSRRSYSIPTDADSRFPVNFSSASGDILTSRLQLPPVQSFRPSNVISKNPSKTFSTDYSYISPRMYGKSEHESECRSDDNSNNLPSSDISLKNLCLMNTERIPSVISSENTCRMPSGHENGWLPVNYELKSEGGNAGTLQSRELDEVNNKLQNCKEIPLKPLSRSDSAVIRDLRHFLSTWDDGDDDETNSVMPCTHPLSNDCAQEDYVGESSLSRVYPSVGYPQGKSGESCGDLYRNSSDDVSEMKVVPGGNGDYESIDSCKEFSSSSGNNSFHDLPRLSANITNGVVDDLNISLKSSEGLRKDAECIGVKSDINILHSDAELKSQETFDESLFSSHHNVNPREINGIAADIMVKDYIRSGSSISDILNSSFENGEFTEKPSRIQSEEETTRNPDSVNSSWSETISPEAGHCSSGHENIREKLCSPSNGDDIITEAHNKGITCTSKQEAVISELKESQDILLRESHESNKVPESVDNPMKSSQSFNSDRSSHETYDELLSHSSQTKTIAPKKLEDASDTFNWVSIEAKKSINGKYSEHMSDDMKGVKDIEDISNCHELPCEASGEELGCINGRNHKNDQMIQLKENYHESSLHNNEVDVASASELSSVKIDQSLLEKGTGESLGGDKFIPGGCIMVEKKVLTDTMHASVEYASHEESLHSSFNCDEDDREKNHLELNSKMLKENVLKYKSENYSTEALHLKEDKNTKSSSLGPCRGETPIMTATKYKKRCRSGCVNMDANTIKKLSYRAVLIIRKKYHKIKLKNKLKVRLRELRDGVNKESSIGKKDMPVTSKKHKCSPKKKYFSDGFKKQNSFKIGLKVGGIKTEKMKSCTSRCMIGDPQVLAGKSVDKVEYLKNVCHFGTKASHSSETLRQYESYDEQHSTEYPDCNHIEELPIENMQVLSPQEERQIQLGSFENNPIVGSEVFMGTVEDANSSEESAERESLDNELRGEPCSHEETTSAHYWCNYEIGNDLGVAMEIEVGSDTQSEDNLALKQDVGRKVNLVDYPDFDEPERCDSEKEFALQGELEMNFKEASAIDVENICDDSEGNIIGGNSVKGADEDECTSVGLSTKEHLEKSDATSGKNVIFPLNESKFKEEIILTSSFFQKENGQTLDPCNESLELKNAITVTSVNNCQSEVTNVDVLDCPCPGSPRNDIIDAADSEIKCIHDGSEVEEINQQEVSHPQVPEKSTWSLKSIRNKTSAFLNSCKKYKKKLENSTSEVASASHNISECKSTHNGINEDSNPILNSPSNSSDIKNMNLYSTTEIKDFSATEKATVNVGLPNETSIKNDDNPVSMLSCDAGACLKEVKWVPKKMKAVAPAHFITNEVGLTEINQYNSSKPLLQAKEDLCEKELLTEECKNKVLIKAKLVKKNKFYFCSKDGTNKDARDGGKIIKKSHSAVYNSQSINLNQVPIKESSIKEHKHEQNKKNFTLNMKASVKSFGSLHLLSVQYPRKGLWRNRSRPCKKINAKTRQNSIKNTSKMPHLPTSQPCTYSLPHILGLCTTLPPPPLSPIPVLPDAMSTSCSPCHTASSDLYPPDFRESSHSNDHNREHTSCISDTHLSMTKQHSGNPCEISPSPSEPIIPENQRHEDLIGINSKEENFSAVEVALSKPLELIQPLLSNDSTIVSSKPSQAVVNIGCDAPLVEVAPLCSPEDDVQSSADVPGIGKPFVSQCSTVNSSVDLTGSNPKLPPHVCITLKKVGHGDKKKMWKKRTALENISKNHQHVDVKEVKKLGSSECESPVPKVTIKKKSGEMGYQSFLSGFSSASPSPSASPTITSKPESPPHTPPNSEKTSVGKCNGLPTKGVNEKAVSGDSSPLMSNVKYDHNSQGSESSRKGSSPSIENAFFKSIVEKKEGAGLKFVIRGLGDKVKECSVKQKDVENNLLSPSKESNHAQSNSLETSEYSVTSGDDGWESGPWSIWQPVVKLSRSCKLDALARELNSMDEDNGYKPKLDNIQSWRRVKKIRHSSKKRNEHYRSPGSRDASTSVQYVGDKIKGCVRSSEKVGKNDEVENNKMLFNRRSHLSECGISKEALGRIQNDDLHLHLSNKKPKSESSLNEFQSIRKPVSESINISCQRGEAICQLDSSSTIGERKTSRDILHSDSNTIRNSTKEVPSGKKCQEWLKKSKLVRDNSSTPTVSSEKVSSNVKVKDKKKRTWDDRVKDKHEHKDKQITVVRDGINTVSGVSEKEKEFRCKELNIIPSPGSKVGSVPSKGTLTNVLEDNAGPKSKEKDVKKEHVSYKIQVPQKEDLPTKKPVCEKEHPERHGSGQTFSCEACSRKFSSQKWLSHHCKGVSHSRVENAQRKAVQALMLLFTGNESNLLQPLTDKEHSRLRNWATHAVPSPLQLALKEFLKST